MMKKKIRCCVLGMSMIAVLLTGCVNEKRDVKSGEVNESVSEQTGNVEEESETIKQPEVFEELETEAEEGTETETAVTIENVLEEEYEDFLNNKKELFFDKYNQYEVLEDKKYFEEGKGYTLSEIVDVLTEHYFEYSDDKEMESVSYAYIDCGMDGVKELAICFTGMDIYGQNDDSTLVYIIKNIDDRLQLCYCYETWARCGASINEYGYYVSAGSGGASNHSADSGLIDKNGEWQYIAGIEQEADIFLISYPEELSKICTVAQEKTYDGTIVFYTISLVDYKEKGRYVGTSTEDEIYSFEVYDENFEKIVEPDMYTDSVYKEIFDEAGVAVLSDVEITAKVAEKEKQVGLTEEIRNGQEITWSILE